MQVGTPVSLEEAISFLYGSKPKINSKNITDLMEIAEYLIIPGLKVSRFSVAVHYHFTVIYKSI